ncbi:hypothetical protein KAJ02_11860 [Candidatus Bipolaricaulota bacterium]|nr:hypothetical protein [Candidatus Bipolaricaulota bacterium]
MAIKATLRLILTADDVVVAESDDARIWQAAFQAIQGANVEQVLGTSAPDQDAGIDWVPEEERAAILSLASDLGIEPQALLSACHPRMIAPYIFLNKRYWEAFKHQTAERGRTAVSNAVLAISLLLLWGEKINLERVALRDGMAVLKTISARDEHASRAVENCPWLQKTMGKIVLNPEKVSRAIAVARAFCTQSAPEWSEEEG